MCHVLPWEHRCPARSAETVLLAILEAYPAVAADEIGFTGASCLYIR